MMARIKRIFEWLDPRSMMLVAGVELKPRDTHKCKKLLYEYVCEELGAGTEKSVCETKCFTG